jgi:hypothetical protein
MRSALVFHGRWAGIATREECLAVEHRGSDRDTTRASSAHNYAQPAMVRQAQPAKRQQRDSPRLRPAKFRNTSCERDKARSRRSESTRPAANESVSFVYNSCFRLSTLNHQHSTS